MAMWISKLEQLLGDLRPIPPAASLESALECALNPAKDTSNYDLERPSSGRISPLMPQDYSVPTSTPETQPSLESDGICEKEILHAESTLRKLPLVSPQDQIESALALDLSEDVLFEEWLLDARPSPFSAHQGQVLAEQMTSCPDAPAPSRTDPEHLQAAEANFDAPAHGTLPRRGLVWLGLGTAAILAIGLGLDALLEPNLRLWNDVQRPLFNALSNLNSGPDSEAQPLGTSLHQRPQDKHRSADSKPTTATGLNSQKQGPKTSQASSPKSPPPMSQRLADAASDPSGEVIFSPQIPGAHENPAKALQDTSAPLESLPSLVFQLNPPPSSEDAIPGLFALTRQDAAKTAVESSKEPKNNGSILDSLIKGEAESVLPSELFARLRATGPVETVSPTTSTTDTSETGDHVLFETADANVHLQVRSEGGEVTVTFSFPTGGSVSGGQIANLADLLSLAMKAAAVLGSTPPPSTSTGD